VSLVFWSCYLLLLRPFVLCNDLMMGRRAVDFRGSFSMSLESPPCWAPRARLTSDSPFGTNRRLYLLLNELYKTRISLVSNVLA